MKSHFLINEAAFVHVLESVTLDMPFSYIIMSLYLIKLMLVFPSRPSLSVFPPGRPSLSVFPPGRPSLSVFPPGRPSLSVFPPGLVFLSSSDHLSIYPTHNNNFMSSFLSIDVQDTTSETEHTFPSPSGAAVPKS